MNITAAILTIREGVDLSELGEVLKHEQETVKRGKNKGSFMTSIYVKVERAQ
jgi:hypothetical protein